MSEKLLISGGRGDFAQEVMKHNTEYKPVYAPDKKAMDITDRRSIELVVEYFKPDVFLHPAALTRPMVKHTDNPELSIQTNIIGTSNVCLVCMKYGIKLVYISTDYVYPGTTGDYKETDPLFPINYYGWSKLGGECAVMLNENSLILRMCMTKRPFVHKNALVDSTKSLMYIDEAAKTTLTLMGETGIINVGGSATNCYDFVKDENPTVGKIYRKDINEKMALNSSMNIDKLKNVIIKEVINEN